MAKKKKPAPRNLSLRDRLNAHWQNGKWEAYAALYLRDRAASDQARQGGRLAAALTNRLSQALFLDRDYAAALEFARLLESEGRSPEGLGCARTALAFLEMRQGVTPSPPEFDIELPEPYQGLRAALAKSPEAPPAKRGRPSGGPLGKLNSQFRALARARTITPYNSFLKATEELEQLTRSGESASVFRSLRAMAKLLRDLRHKDGGDLREAAAVAAHPAFKEIRPNRSHPALIALWEFVCRQGGARFGDQWAGAVRTLRLKFAPETNPGLAAIHQRLIDGPILPPSLHHYLTARGGEWSEPELYYLTVICLLEFARYEDISMMDKETGEPLPLVWLRTLTGIGRRYRPQAPWTREVSRTVEALMIHDDEIFEWIAEADWLPDEGLTTPSRVLLALRAGQKLPAGQPPRTLTPEEIDRLADTLTRWPPRADGLPGLAGLLTPEALRGLYLRWLETAAESTAVRTSAGEDWDLPWLELDETTLTEALRHLPPKHPVALFTGLFLMAGRDLSREPLLAEEFLEGLTRATRPESGLFADSGAEAVPAYEQAETFSCNLFIMLTRWDKVEPDFLVKLFDLARPVFEETILGRKAAEAVGHMQNPARRRLLAGAVADFLGKKIKRGRPGPSGDLRSLFGALAQGRKLPAAKGSFPLDDIFQDLDPDEMEKFMNKMRRMMGGGRGRK